MEYLLGESVMISVIIIFLLFTINPFGKEREATKC